MFMGIRLLVALLQLQLLRLIPVVLAATALLTSCFRPRRIVDYAPRVSIPCRRAVTAIT